MKVSVIIPFNKDRGFLNEAVKSVKDQSYKDIEIILSESENTVGYNFNRGVEKAKGDYICFLAEDDLLPENSISDRVKLMENYDFIHTRAEQYFDNFLTPYRLTNPNTTFETCLKNNGICGGTIMYRTEIIKRNLMREDLTTAEEWELNLRLLRQGYNLGYSDKITYFYRRHKGQKSIGNTSKEYQTKRQKVKDYIRSLYE